MGKENENIVDARGLSCPEPAMMTRKAVMEAKSGRVVVLTDSVTSRNNASRTAQMAGWNVEIEEEPDGSFRLVMTK
jgi:tRNA 2-thiouridine synthesizing protein A